MDGWAWFVRDHLTELVNALGPELAKTKEQFERRQEVSRKALARYLPPVTVVSRLRGFKATAVGMLVMGPFGWILAAVLLVVLILTR